MIEIIEVLKHEHRNIEKLLQVLERELSIFDRGDRPDYEVVLAMINYFHRLSGLLPSPEGRLSRSSRRAIPLQRRPSAISKPNIERARDDYTGSRTPSSAS